MKNFSSDVYMGKSDVSELIEKAEMSESIDDIAYQCSLEMVVTKELKERGVNPGESIMIVDRKTKKDFYQGVIWDLDGAAGGSGYILVTAFDRMKYLEECEDEYIFPAGQVASQRIRRYCKDWGIPVGVIPGTGVILTKAVYRKRTIRDMMQADLNETALKGGGMYKLRLGRRLDLFMLGSNSEVYNLLPGEGMTEIRQKRSLAGAVTQVKVLGAEKEGQRSPVITIEQRGVKEYGTIQKIIQKEKITNVREAKAAAKDLLAGDQETIDYVGIDIPVIRAGDRVRLQGRNFLAVDVFRALGNPGTMNLTLASEQYVRRCYFGGRL